MALAIPSQAFSDVQRYLRQKRAGGQTVSPTEEGRAWQSYWDVQSARADRARELGIREASLAAQIEMNKEQIDLREKQMRREQAAARVAGIAELGTSAALIGLGGAHVLKGTALGAKIGLGAAAPTVTGGAAAAKVGAEAGGGAAGWGAAWGGTTAESAAAPLTLGAAAGPAAAGAAVGYLGSELGEQIIGNDAGEVIGGAAGGAAAGAAIGSVVPGVGTAIGGIIGGAIGGVIGAVKAVKD